MKYHSLALPCLKVVLPSQPLTAVREIPNCLIEMYWQNANLQNS